MAAEVTAARQSRRARTGTRPSARSNVLYDAPGPRGRMLIRIASILAGVLVLVAAWSLVYRPLQAKGQFAYDLWGPLVDPSNENVRLLWTRLGHGIAATLEAAGLAIVTSAVCGALLAVLRVQLRHLLTYRYARLPGPAAWVARVVSWALNAASRVCVDIFRGLPVVITIFFVARVLPVYGVNLHDVVWYLVIGLTLYNMVVIAEILRSGMEGLPKGQSEAAASIGLSSRQTTMLILLPQAVRIMLPALIGQLVVILKDTSLGFIISYEELLNVAKTVTLVLSNPIQTYLVVALIYLVINYLLSRLATWLQGRLSYASS